MKRALVFPSHAPSQVPSLIWLEIAELTLKIAHDLFAVSKKLHHVRLLEWIGMRVLNMAARALGHAPGQKYLEFRADIPMQI